MDVFLELLGAGLALLFVGMVIIGLFELLDL